tara:strand:- start:82 stop:504 length:423 start_codon:yes stop_codon:yes gene_type:complete
MENILKQNAQRKYRRIIMASSLQASVSFKWSELECKCGCGTRYVQDEAIDTLQRLRNILQRPMIINSAARCPLHNVRVGGSPKSQHRATEQCPSTAFDISLKGLDKQDLIEAAKAAGFKGLGINYKSFVHVDNRKYFATW